jgi:hypothetical protein
MIFPLHLGHQSTLSDLSATVARNTTPGNKTMLRKGKIVRESVILHIFPRPLS